MAILEVEDLSVEFPTDDGVVKAVDRLSYDLDANEVATLSRYARALGARLRIIFDYGNELHQIA